MFPGIPNITKEEQSFDQGDALKSEIEAFLDAVITGRPPVVSGEDGRHALETALLIIKKL
jgi:predicted dehydrogenase